MIVLKRSSTSFAVGLIGASARVAATITATVPSTTRALAPRETTTWAIPAAISANQAERTNVYESATATTPALAIVSARALWTVR